MKARPVLIGAALMCGRPSDGAPHSRSEAVGAQDTTFEQVLKTPDADGAQATDNADLLRVAVALVSGSGRDLVRR